MAPNPALIGTVVRSPRRPRLSFAVAALATLALAACGSEETSAGGLHNKAADTVRAHTITTSPSADQQVAFMDMLDTIAQPCFPDSPSQQEPTPPGEKPPTTPVEMLPIDKTPPASPPAASGSPATPQKVELGATEKCAGRLHAERITKALSGMTDPTPAKVRQILNDLGYIDERIHDLMKSGPTTRFFIDLRFMGGSLSLDGSVTGTKAVIEAFGTPETGPFTSVKRKQ
ncbi:hypothetical protein [Streptomyces cellulosae]|uniref:hypothetical protein n=1 Tax=Streptomyces cellulosae TaxID=1968 RepID=UPI00131DAC8B|nr:hypothetical protein [Streptomyces cellulosae]